MVETAVSLSLALLTLYGAFDLGLMGYFQLQLDGATFFYTHAYASGASDINNVGKFGSQIANLFPSVATANMSPIPQSPPDTDMPVNYTQWGTVTQRYGGASLLRPQRLMAQATYQVAGGTWNALFPAASQPITLSAGNVDARPIIGNHDDDAQGAGFNSSTVYGSLVDPLTQDDQNVPPYYFNFAFMWECTPVSNPPSGSPSPNWNSHGDTCNDPELNSLGLAEYVKDDNYGSAKYPNNGIDSGGTYEAIKYHQQVYAAISSALALYPTRRGNGGIATIWDSVVGSTIRNTIESWDVQNIQNIGAPSGSQLGRQNPLHPLNGCSWC
jgi:hypothetical protein